MAQRPLSWDTFIERAIKKHGDTYRYFRDEFVNGSEKTRIFCTLHNVEFYQAPKNHMRWSGCEECEKIARSVVRQDTKETFESKARVVHGDRYSYADVEYKSAQTKVKILCEEHGGFYQQPDSHLQGSGCPKCANSLMGKNAPRMTRDEFLKRVIALHDGKYTYENSVFINTRIDIKITCPIHGDFSQRPNKHLSGNGCPACQRSRGGEKVAKALDGLGIEYIPEKSFTDLKSTRLLRFDFFIPSLGLAIEYQGQQHFEEIGNWGGEQGLAKRQKRDQIKRDWCVKNGITLVEIPYTESDISAFMQTLLFD